MTKIRERDEAPRQTQGRRGLRIANGHREVVSEATQVVQGSPNREMRRGLHAMVQCNPAQQGRGFRPGFVVDHLPVCALHLLPGRGGNRAGLRDRARRRHRPFLQAEVV